MKHARTAASILLVFLLIGCASDAITVEQLKTGMTRAQVEELQGEPGKVQTSGNYTALRYGPDYYVILEHGLVIAFGEGTISRYPGTDRFFINESY